MGPDPFHHQRPVGFEENTVSNKNSEEKYSLQRGIISLHIARNIEGMASDISDDADLKKNC